MNSIFGGKNFIFGGKNSIFWWKEFHHWSFITYENKKRNKKRKGGTRRYSSKRFKRVLSIHFLFYFVFYVVFNCLFVFLKNVSRLSLLYENYNCELIKNYISIYPIYDLLSISVYLCYVCLITICNLLIELLAMRIGVI